MVCQAKILIVEDESYILELLLRIVETVVPPSQILTAANGEEGLLQASRHSPDLIITGLRMPKMDGYKMVQQLRQRKSGNVTPIIGLSGTDPNLFSTMAFRAVCNDFLNKPFIPDELLAKVNFWLQSENLSGLSLSLYQPEKWRHNTGGKLDLFN